MEKNVSDMKINIKKNVGSGAARQKKHETVIICS
jgi:hypothetical protein